MSDAQVTRAFTQYYTRQATLEFAEDLDRLRGAEDFKEDALALLVQALQQGTALFSTEEQRRVVMGEMEAESGREKGSAG
jgi:ribosome assembly protein 3